MGSCYIENTFLAETVDEAYDQAVEAGNREYGENPYSGYFNCCEFDRVTKTYVGKVTKERLKEAYEIAEKDEDCDKWQCRAIDLGIHHYEIIHPKIVKNYKKAKAKFVIRAGDFLNKQYDTLTEAKETALKETLNTGEMTTVSKCYVDETTGSANLFQVLPNIKICKKVPKNIPKGCRLREIHEFLLYGWPGI